jgi:Homeodomain-like domain
MCSTMHARSTRSAALRLIAEGLNDAEIERRLGVPRRTIRDWRVREPARQLVCLRCWLPTAPVTLAPADYAELLGLYLGDGHITDMPRTQRLRIFLDAKYPGIVSGAAALLGRCLPANRVGTRLSGTTMAVVSTHHRHLGCLFPQHGPGKKHERAMVFEQWQRAHVEAAPWAFLRGCINSDGCTFVNRFGRYAYLSYEFRNRSEGIKALFVETCDQVGVRYRINGDRVRICQRPSVALLQEYVGTKA